VKLEAYAKVNFTLEVFGVRADGYHSIRSLVLPVSLSDTIELEKSDTLTSNSGYADDLCIRAARALGVTGANILVTKRIPAGGGLGGGSADAAAVLIGLNELYSLGHSRERLAEIGAKVGSDVPSLVFEGPVVMKGRGEIVAPIDLPTLHLVIVNPGVHSSTAEVYANCCGRNDDGLDLTNAAINAIRSGCLSDIAASLVNDLQDPAIAIHPEISAAMLALSNAGLAGVAMSGSGSCVFGIAESPEQAMSIADDLKSREFTAWNVHTL